MFNKKRKKGRVAWRAAGRGGGGKITSLRGEANRLKKGGGEGEEALSSPGEKKELREGGISIRSNRNKKASAGAGGGLSHKKEG